ncbi:hypothetical protein [Ruminococcus bicirculans (ex Wegman et al. 2014)]|uniref:hypothetical protein n=1 Tax=Ruminococcus bicirculans (ex Wegman et al. 2014) TaxID=1160721 RepID=UPI003FD7C2BC
MPYTSRIADAFAGTLCSAAATCCRIHAWRQTVGLGARACVRRSTHPRSVSDSRDACRVSVLSSALPASPSGITKAAAATHNGSVHILLLYIIALITRAFK